MNRKDFQQLSEIRLKEAEALLAAGCFEGAYYLAGYAVECAFKACIAKKTQEHDFPDKKLVERSHTHDLERLADAAGLLKLIESEVKNSKDFETQWELVSEWTEHSRYRFFPQEGKLNSIAYISLRMFLDAIENTKGGILPWIKQYW